MITTIHVYKTPSPGATLDTDYETHVVLREMREYFLREARAMCNGNLAGYRTQELAELAAVRMDKLMAEGHETYFVPMRHFLHVHMSWRRRTDDCGWSRVEFTHMGDEFSQIDKACKLLRVLGRRIQEAGGHTGDVSSWTFHDPDPVIAAAARIPKARYVQQVEGAEMYVPIRLEGREAC